jgi:putative colanic acid biosynthesis UDP-glucose lipid carrier transferase
MDASLRTDSVDSPLGFSVSPAKPKPSPAKYGPRWSKLLFATDVAMFVASASLAAQLHFGSQRPATHLGFVLAIGPVLALWLFLFYRIGLYRQTLANSVRDEVYFTIAALAIGVLPEFALFSIAPSISVSRLLLLEMLAISAVLVPTSHAVLRVIWEKAAIQAPRRIAIVGTYGRVNAVVDELHLTARDAILRLSLDDFDARLAQAMDNEGTLDLPWMRGALEWQCDTLIVTEALPPSIVPAMLRTTEARGVKLAFAPTRIRPQAYDFSLQKDGGLALICPRSLAICNPRTMTLRRIFDLALVVPSMVVAAPIMALVALAVYLDDRGPVIYRQTRVGLGGKPFEILKFRSMPVDAEKQTGPVWSDPKRRLVTRIGGFLRKTSLDELPQLFNVIRGEMALVGPRPERPFYVEKFRRVLPRYDERHLVRPGITGWSHIHMRRNVDLSAISERLAYDLFYIENWSLFLDVSILVKTLAEFLFHRVA